MSPIRGALLAASVLAAGCAPTLRFNQSFLTAEELKVSSQGYASLKSTGESFDLGPVRAQEGKVDRVLVLKVHGSYLLVGEGFKHLYRLWPGGKDEAHYKPVSLEAGAAGFTSVSLEPSGKCGLFKWQNGAGQAHAFVTAGGDVDATRCSDE